jgi:hypothetical protein
MIVNHMIECQRSMREGGAKHPRPGWSESQRRSYVERARRWPGLRRSASCIAGRFGHPTLVRGALTRSFLIAANDFHHSESAYASTQLNVVVATREAIASA